MTPRSPLDQRVAVITGAASGIGRETAKRFLAEGFRVLVVDRPGSALAEAFPDVPGTARCEMDITEPDAPNVIVAAALAAFQRLDVLVNNAGVSGYAPIDTMSQDWWDRTIATNLTAAFRLTQAAIPALRLSPAGRIINVGSPMAVLTDFGMGAYGASKAGLASLTRSLAFELGKDGITANYVEPGAIRTAITDRAWRERPDLEARRATQAALGRIGEPEDLAGVIFFLASDDAAFITGQGVRVDGGLTLRA